MSDEAIAQRLIPQPQRVEAHSGVFRLVDGMALCAAGTLEEPEQGALARFRRLCAEVVGVCLEPQTPETCEPARGIVARVARGASEAERIAAAAATPACAAQGYHLCVRPDQVELIGTSPAGLFNGVQTLGQLARVAGSEWPCMTIEDFPDFAVRGLSEDVSRGKVPKLDTLKELAEQLAALKVNQLQLYVEHTFAFAFNPNIARGCSPLTAEEISELDGFCAERRIELIPSVASFGHMGRVLSLPEYRHLAEVETTKSWEEMCWRERMRGLTLDSTNAQSRELLTRMYGEFLPLFSSKQVNVSGDETYDLAKGKSKDRADQIGVGRVYLEHIKWLHEYCRSLGKRIMFWGDMIKKYPELIRQIPQDAVVLNWDYRVDADYESTALFCEAGLETYVCPGTCAWNRVFSDINKADVNIRRHSAAGKRHGAVGLLNTDWGDDGHVNVLGGAWHPIFLGAATAWNADSPAPEDFDLAFGRQFFGDEEGAAVRALRKVVATSGVMRSWPAFYAPLSESIPASDVADEGLRQWQSASRDAVELFREMSPAGLCQSVDMQELEVACRISALVAERMLLSRRLAGCDARADQAANDRARTGAGRDDDCPLSHGRGSVRRRFAPGRLNEDLRRFADACEAVIPDYEKTWRQRNKPSYLHEISAVFRRVAAEARAAAEHDK